MDRLLFGTGGVPHSAKGGTSLAGIERIYELGLGHGDGIRSGRPDE